MQINDYMVPLYEFLVNSFQSIAERYGAENVKDKGKVLINIERSQRNGGDLLNPITAVSIEDNGIGFNDVNFSSFTRAYSEKKAQLGGKGVGRFAALAVFDAIEIESVYEGEQGTRFKRCCRLARSSKSEVEDISHGPTDEEIRTIIHLKNIREEYSEETAGVNTDELAANLLQHVFLYFINNQAPEVIVNDGTSIINLDDSGVIQEKVIFSADCQHANTNFSVFGVRKEKENVNWVMYCAHNRAVMKKKLKTILPLIDGPITLDKHNMYFDIYILSDYLDSIVKSGRNGFNFPKKNDASEKQGELSTIKIDEAVIDDLIVETLEDRLKDVVNDLRKTREKQVEKFMSGDDGIEYRNVKITPAFLNKLGANATHKEIRNYLTEEKIRRSEYINEQKDILMERDYSNQADYQELMQRVLQLYQEENSEQLAKYVRHRKVILELMERYLGWVDSSNEKYKNELALHNIIYTMGATQADMSYDKHNLWILDDRLAFYRYIASDKSIRSHEALNNPTASRKEPDIALYDVPFVYGEKDDGDEIKTIVVFELKRPERDITYLQYIQQSDEQINGLREGLRKDDNGSRLPAQPNTPIFFYYVCDEKAYNSLVKDLSHHNYYATPYNSIVQADHITHKEILTYRTLLANAKRRNKMFFKKLGLE